MDSTNKLFKLQAASMEEKEINDHRSAPQNKCIDTIWYVKYERLMMMMMMMIGRPRQQQNIN